MTQHRIRLIPRRRRPLAIEQLEDRRPLTTPSVGGFARTTLAADVRSQPDLAAPEIVDAEYRGSAPTGLLAAVIDGPRHNSGLTWWRVDFSGKYNGWVRGDALAAATVPYTRGIDVSHWQGVINWTSVKNAGFHFAFMKASESTDFVDPRFLQNVTNGTKAGVLHGFYHLARPGLQGGSVAADARAEAAHFVNTAGAYIRAPYLPPVLDLEHGFELGRSTLSAWTRAWLTEVKRLTGVQPMIYMSSWPAKNLFEPDLKQYGLWLARWTLNLDEPPLPDDPGIWPNWTFWQYSSTTAVPGISGNVDGDVFKGSLTDLQAWARAAVPDTIPPVVNGVSASPSSIVAGQDMTVRWTATDHVAVDHIGLFLYQNGVAVDTRPYVSGGTSSGLLAANAASLPNTGTYRWTVPAGLPAGDYQIRVVAWDGEGNSSPEAPSAFSNRFSVSHPPLERVTGTAGDDTYYVVQVGSQLHVYENPGAPGPVGILTYSSELAAMNGSLTINTLGGDDTLIVNPGPGAPGLGLEQLIYHAGIGANRLVLEAGSARIESTADSLGTLDITVQAGAHLTASRLRAGALTLGDGSRVTILPGGVQPSVLTSLNLGTSGTLDLNDNDLAIKTTAANKRAVFDALYERLASGFARGAWNGRGLISSAARTNPDMTISIVDNAVLGASDFSGEPVDANTILVKYTVFGDLDHNGRVDADDLTIFANNFGRSFGATQVDGDVDFNGTVDGDDLTVFANNFGRRKR